MRVPVKWATILMEEGVLAHREAEIAAKGGHGPNTIDADSETTESLARKLGQIKQVAVVKK